MSFCRYEKMISLQIDRKVIEIANDIWQVRCADKNYRGLRQFCFDGISSAG